ncbi:pseudouridine synthase, partial [Genlisea aurea]
MRLRNLMEGAALPSHTPAKDYVHYQHNDAFSLCRWTAKESYQFMYSRPWQRVNCFYLELVNGRRTLSELFPKEKHAIHDTDRTLDVYNYPSASLPNEQRTGRWARLTFKIILSYHGYSFDGWQKQPGLNTVQGLIENSLGVFIDEKKALQLKEKNLPRDGCAVVAGRTDKGVSALGQVCSFYTWRKEVEAEDIMEAINDSAPGKLRVTSVSQVSREFHPNFSAKWRRYLYIFPLNHEYRDREAFKSEKNDFCGDNCLDDQSGMQTGCKPLNFEVSRVSQLLLHLEGKLLSFRMFARDTKASRSIGPPTECFIFHARAAEAYLPCSEEETKSKIMCVELVADRFLRKMVRVLVATAIREAAAGADEDMLLQLMGATCRRATAPPAPPDGLCLVDVGYTEFDRKVCLI